MVATVATEGIEAMARPPALPGAATTRPISRAATSPNHAPTTTTKRITVLNTKLISWALGIWSALAFVVCVVYGVVTPQSLHMPTLLEQLLPAFKWLTWPGVLLGLVESFLYGAYAGLTFCPIYNFLHRRMVRKFTVDSEAAAAGYVGTRGRDVFATSNDRS